MEDDNDGEIEEQEGVDYQRADSSLMFYLTAIFHGLGWPLER